MSYRALLAFCFLSAAVGYTAGASASPREMRTDHAMSPAESVQDRRGVDSPLPMQAASCGDYRCDPPEDCQTCPEDCGGCCGNGRCEPPEDHDTCPDDC